MHPLDGCRAKLRQAEAHAQSLDAELRAFAKLGGPRVAHKGDPQTGDYIFYVKMVEEPPLVDWGVRIGDVMHNLHSALDHLAWQLAIFHLRREPTDREAKGVHFPIALTRPDFDSLPVLSMFNPAHVTMLRRLQPYERGDRPRAEQHSLAILKRLSNTDKHRIIHTAHVALKEFPFEARAVRDCEIVRVITPPDNIPLVDGQELARVQGISTGPESEIEGNAKLSGRIAFSDGTSVQELLDRLGRSVRNVVREFEAAL